MQKKLNFRDFGSYPTIHGKWIKQGLLYRSGSLDKVRRTDLRIIESLGFRTVIDLRTQKESRGDLSISSARRVTIPLDFDQLTRERIKPFLFKKNSGNFIIDAINSVYEEMVIQSLPQLAQLFSILLSEMSYPLIIHCRGGKDRTGFMVAVIQLALGTQTEFIVYDYLKSNELLMDSVNNVTALSKWLTLGIFPHENLRTTFTAQEKYIKTVMDSITNQYHGIEEYIKNAGIRTRELQQLREILLTNEPPSFPKIC